MELQRQLEYLHWLHVYGFSVVSWLYVVFIGCVTIVDLVNAAPYKWCVTASLDQSRCPLYNILNVTAIQFSYCHISLVDIATGVSFCNGYCIEVTGGVTRRHVAMQILHYHNYRVVAARTERKVIDIDALGRYSPSTHRHLCYCHNHVVVHHQS